MEIVNEMHEQPVQRQYHPIDIKDSVYPSAFTDDDWRDSKSLVYFNEELTHKIIIKLTN